MFSLTKKLLKVLDGSPKNTASMPADPIPLGSTGAPPGGGTGLYKMGERGDKPPLSEAAQAELKATVIPRKLDPLHDVPYPTEAVFKRLAEVLQISYPNWLISELQELQQEYEHWTKVIEDHSWSGAHKTWRENRELLKVADSDTLLSHPHRAPHMLETPEQIYSKYLLISREARHRQKEVTEKTLKLIRPYAEKFHDAAIVCAERVEQSLVDIHAFYGVPFTNSVGLAIRKAAFIVIQRSETVYCAISPSQIAAFVPTVAE